MDGKPASYAQVYVIFTLISKFVDKVLVKTRTSHAI